VQIQWQRKCKIASTSKQQKSAGTKTVRKELKLPGNELRKSTIELCLFAPRNESVEFIGSWNDWRPRGCKHGDDGWWRCQCEVMDGKYFYKFRAKALNDKFAEWAERVGLGIVVTLHYRWQGQLRFGWRRIGTALSRSTLVITASLFSFNEFRPFTRGGN
jgi:1,4-alpha-glucan branching enzyme